MKEIRYFSKRRMLLLWSAMGVWFAAGLIVAGIVSVTQTLVWLIWPWVICAIALIIARFALLRCPHCGAMRRRAFRMDHVLHEYSFYCTYCGGEVRFK